jgi:uncharacterized membrane protein
MRLDCCVHDRTCFWFDHTSQRIGLIHYVFAVLRLMAPFMAIVRLLVAPVYAGATIAGIHAVAAITFALLMTVLYVGTIARPIG